jgi:hypothetical protein
MEIIELLIFVVANGGKDVELYIAVEAAKKSLEP